MPITMHVTADHRATLERIFRHPESGNIEWRQVLSLLEAVGTVAEEHNGKLKVTLGDKTEVLRPSRDKDVEKDTIVELRRMLSDAGLTPEVFATSPAVELTPPDSSLFRTRARRGVDRREARRATRYAWLTR